MILLGQGFPFDVVFSLERAELLAYAITAQEVQTGSEYNWDRMMWVETK